MTKFTITQLKILKNFNWLFSAYVYRFIIGFATLAYVTRYLGPEKYGLYSYSLSAFYFVEIFLHIINQEVLKKNILETDNSDSILKTVFVFQIGLSVTLLGVVQLILWKLNVEVGDRRVLMSIFSVGLLFRPIDVISFYFSSQMRNDLISRSEIGVVTLFNLLRAALVFLKLHLYSFAWAMVISKTLNFIFLSFYFIKLNGIKFLKAKFDSNILKGLLKSSLPLFLATAASVVFTRIDQIMLGNLMENSTVGIYAVVVKLTEPWIFIAAILTQSVYPSLISSYKKDYSNFIHKIRKTLCILFYISLGIICGTWVFGDFVVEAIFSEKYLVAVPILKIHVFYIIFVFWISLTNQYDVIVGATHITLIKTVIASIINVALNYFLIKEIGILGATYATIISYVFSSFLVNLFFKQTRTLFILQCKSLIFWRISWFHKESS